MGCNSVTVNNTDWSVLSGNSWLLRNVSFVEHLIVLSRFASECGREQAQTPERGKEAQAYSLLLNY
jgi:hypothetical protein